MNFPIALPPRHVPICGLSVLLAACAGRHVQLYAPESDAPIEERRRAYEQLLRLPLPPMLSLATKKMHLLSELPRGSPRGS